MQGPKDSEERKNEFIEVAEKLFQENGIVDTTINSIVKDMNVAKGLFYYYFKSKDDVIDAISEKYNQVFTEMLKSEPNQMSYDERVHQFVKNCVYSFRKLNSRFVNKDDVDLTVLITKSVEEAKKVSIMGLTALLEEGNELGRNFEHPEYYADILISGINTLVTKGQATDDEIIHIIIDMIERSGEETE